MAINTATITDPTVNNDASQGYAAGSTWRNLTNGNLWTCSDAMVGAAVWALATTGATVKSVWGDTATAVYDQRSRGVLQDIGLLLTEIRDLLRGNHES